MDYRDNRQRWAESHQVVHFYAGQWCTFTPALTAQSNDMGGTLLRSVGLARAKARIGLKNLAYNMRRLVQLDRLAAAV